MVDLGLVANLATAAAVVVAFTLGLLQFRQFERKRADTAALEVLHSFQSPDLMRAFLDVLALPEGLTAEEVEARGPDFARDVAAIVIVCETLGVMVQRRVVPLDIVDDVMGDWIRRSWRRLRPFAELRRAQWGTPNFFEWYPWLAERLEELDRPSKRVGAHVAHRAWRP